MPVKLLGLKVDLSACEVKMSSEKVLLWEILPSLSMRFSILIRKLRYWSDSGYWWEDQTFALRDCTELILFFVFYPQENS